MPGRAVFQTIAKIGPGVIPRISAAERFARALRYELADHIFTIFKKMILSPADGRDAITPSEIQECFSEIRYDLSLLKKEDLAAFLLQHKLELLDFQHYVSSLIAGRKHLFSGKEEPGEKDPDIATKLFSCFLLSSAAGNALAALPNPGSKDTSHCEEVLSRLPLSADFKKQVEEFLLRKHSLDPPCAEFYSTVPAFVVLKLNCFASKRAHVLKEFILCLKEKDPVTAEVLNSKLVTKSSFYILSSALEICFPEDSMQIFSMPVASIQLLSSPSGFLAVQMLEKERSYQLQIQKIADGARA